MAEFVSEIKQISQNDDCIFEMLSDLSNLEKVKDRIPQDKIKDFEFDRLLSKLWSGNRTRQLSLRQPILRYRFSCGFN